jgi:predicted deacylase
MKTLLIAISAAIVVQSAGPTQSSLSDLKTRPERTDYRETSRYDDVVAFMNDVAEAAPTKIRLTTFGKTVEGRTLPLAIVGAPAATSQAVLGTGKLRVFIQGNIHAGEVEGKESAQMLLRDLAEGRHAEWLESMVLLIAPIYNADGNERISPTNRSSQNGPIEGMGQRPNAQGYDLNRDHMKLDSPEAQSLIKLWTEYDPHVGIDLHTTNGSQHAYHLTYSPPLNPNTALAITVLLKNEWFPFMTKNVKAKHGWDFFYYGNVSGGGRGEGRPSTGSGQAAAPQTAPAPSGPREWATFEHVPRFNNNYIGMRNRFGILSEAYSYATFQDRIKATSWFLEEMLTYASRNAGRIRAATRAADAERLIGKTLATRARLHRGGMIEVLMGETEEEKNPVTGRGMRRRKDVSKPEQMVDATTFEPSATEVVPQAYYVPRDATAALALLRAHGIRMGEVTRAVKDVEQFAIESARTQSFQLHDMRIVEGKWQRAPDVVVPEGSWVVQMNQPLARLAFYLLEPMSDDGLTVWNTLDTLLEGAKTHPILRKR